MSNNRIKVETVLDADSKKAWSYYNEPKHITGWNFADESWQCPFAENDLRAGGKYKARMEAKDGSFGFDFEATYDEVEDGKRFSYTLGDGRKVITEFESIGEKTKVTTEFDVESQNPIEMQRDGWQAILNNYKRYVESN